MKYFFYTIILVSLLACNDRSSAQIIPKFGKPSEAANDNFEFSPETAHPNARKLMTEDFLWSNIDDAAPFGSDAGSDAAYLFRQWRQRYPAAKPVTFLREWINSWQTPYFDWNELDSAKISEYLKDTGPIDTSAGLRGEYLLRQDQAIVGTAFAQFVLEGKVDTELKKITITALTRQMSPVVLNLYNSGTRSLRVSTYNKLLSIVQQMNKQ